MNLELKKFDMKKITFKPNENQGPVIVLIGRRDTGKSFLVRDLLYYHQDIPIGTVISGQKLEMDFMVKWFLNFLYMMNIIQLLLKIFLKRQKMVVKAIKKRN